MSFKVYSAASGGAAMRLLRLTIACALLCACAGEQSSNAAGDEITLLRLAGPRVVDWDTSAIGRLVAREGCLVLQTSGETYSVVWPQDARLVHDEGRLIVEAGQWRAPVGETVALTGGETASLAPDAFDAPVTPADTTCPPKYWVSHRFRAGEVAP